MPTGRHQGEGLEYGAGKFYKLLGFDGDFKFVSRAQERDGGGRGPGHFLGTSERFLRVMPPDHNVDPRALVN